MVKEISIETIEITHWAQWAVLAIGAFAIGVSKTGLPGVGILVVPLLAIVFPAKPSVGLLLPILIIADLFAVGYYRHHGQWRHLVKLLPWAVIGIGFGYVILSKIDSQTLKPLIGLIVLAMLAIRLRSILKNDPQHMPQHWSFAAIMGLLAGAITMMANAAGPVMVLYLLSMHFPKQKFIGTAAWFFFIVNWIKVPLMSNLNMITATSLKIDLMVFPAVVLGAVAGIWLLKRIPQRLFNIIALLLATAAAIKLLF
ncbi:MAG: sulfite exporter TauE/SafE family protein [Planctomycetota bacterium]